MQKFSGKSIFISVENFEKLQNLIIVKFIFFKIAQPINFINKTTFRIVFFKLLKHKFSNEA